jgi:hypothetical protein
MGEEHGWGSERRAAEVEAVAAALGEAAATKGAV